MRFIIPFTETFYLYVILISFYCFRGKSEESRSRYTASWKGDVFSCGYLCNGDESWFCCWRKERKTSDSYRKSCTDCCLDHTLQVHPSISDPSCLQPMVFMAHFRGPCQQLQESLMECVSTIFSEGLSTPALYQRTLRQGTKHKQALHAMMTEIPNDNRKENHATLSHRQALVLWRCTY